MYRFPFRESLVGLFIWRWWDGRGVYRNHFCRDEHAWWGTKGGLICRDACVEIHIYEAMLLHCFIGSIKTTIHSVRCSIPSCEPSRMGNISPNIKFPPIWWGVWRGGQVKGGQIMRNQEVRNELWWGFWVLQEKRRRCCSHEEHIWGRLWPKSWLRRAILTAFLQGFLALPWFKWNFENKTWFFVGIGQSKKPR